MTQPASFSEDLIDEWATWVFDNGLPALPDGPIKSRCNHSKLRVPVSATHEAADRSQFADNLAVGAARSEARECGRDLGK